MREKAYTQKKKALYYNLLYSSLLQIVFSVQYMNLHHQIKFHTSVSLIKHQQPTSSHILSQKFNCQHGLRSSTSTASEAVCHWHTQKQDVISWWVKVTHFCRVMANVQISSMLPYIRRWKFLFPPESGSEPMMTRTAWPLCAPAPVPDCSYCEILIELTRISLAVTCAPCLSLTQCLCEKDLACFFLSPPIW